MWDVDQIYNEIYTLYETTYKKLNKDNPSLKDEFDNLLIDVDKIYLDAQNELVNMYSEIKNKVKDYIDFNS